MKNNNSGIYSITSKINGKRYIGSSTRMKTRWKEHKSYLKNNTHHSIHLQNHYNKHGKDDLIFSVVEIVERGDLTIQEFKKLLFDKEQSYLNNWEQCQFNCLKTANSRLGYKIDNSKYYYYEKNAKLYITYYSVNGEHKFFSRHFLEQEAINEVKYIKNLNEKDLIIYYEKCKQLPRYAISRNGNRAVKNYYYDNTKNRWSVKLKINNKSKCFGFFMTEQEAINRVEEVRNIFKEVLRA